MLRQRLPVVSWTCFMVGWTCLGPVACRTSSPQGESRVVDQIPSESYGNAAANLALPPATPPNPSRSPILKENEPASAKDTKGFAASTGDKAKHEDDFRADAELEFEAPQSAAVDTSASVETGAEETSDQVETCDDGNNCANTDASTVALTITSNVEGAKIFIDDILAGKVGENIDIDPGPSRITVEAPGYQAKTVEVTAKLGETIKIHVELGRGH